MGTAVHLNRDFAHGSLLLVRLTRGKRAPPFVITRPSSLASRALTGL
jgi:hypothetical protein